MKPNRINLCTVARESLVEAGYSTVKVVNAVNAELGKLNLVESTDKTADGRLASKGAEYKVSMTVSNKFSGKATIPLTFDAWHSAIAKAEKIAAFNSVAIPGLFTEWLDSFAKTDVEAKPAAKTASAKESVAA